MSRLAYLRNHPKKSLSALATLLLATGLTAGSGAYFSSTDTSAGNSVSTGTLNIDVYGSVDPTADGRDCDEASEQGSADCSNNDTSGSTAGPSTTFDISNLAPTALGGVERAFRVCNSGSLPASIRATSTVTGNGPLADAVRMDVTRLPDARNGGFGGYVNIVADLANPRADAFDDRALDYVQNPTGGAREPLEAGQCGLYALKFRLQEDDSDQSALQGKTYRVKIDVTGKTIEAPGA